MSNNTNYLYGYHYKIILSSAVAGSICFISTLPFDYIKQNIQINKTLKDIKYDVKLHGYKILYRGWNIGLTCIAPQMAIKYYSFYNLNNLLCQYGLDKKLYYQPMLTSFGAGLIDGAFSGPILAIQSFKQLSLKDNLDYKTIIRKNFVNLMIPMSLRNAFYTSIVLGGHSIIKDKYYHNQNMSFFNNLFISSYLTIPGTILACPFDVLCTKYNYNLLQQKNKKVNLYKVFIDIFRTEGIKGFYRGYFNLYTNAILRFPLTFALQIELLDRMNKFIR